MTTHRDRLWHGGFPGLAAGDQLLPPSRTGGRSLLLDSLRQGQTGIAQRADLIYATINRDLARAWAGGWTPDGRAFGGGALYVVELDDPEPDDDMLSWAGVGWQARSGTVLKVYDTHVPAHPTKWANVVRRAMREHDAAKPQPPRHPLIQNQRPQP